MRPSPSRPPASTSSPPKGGNSPGSRSPATSAPTAPSAATTSGPSSSPPAARSGASASPCRGGRPGRPRGDVVPGSLTDAFTGRSGRVEGLDDLGKRGTLRVVEVVVDLDQAGHGDP